MRLKLCARIITITYDIILSDIFMLLNLLDGFHNKYENGSVFICFLPKNSLTILCQIQLLLLRKIYIFEINNINVFTQYMINGARIFI